MWPTLLGLSYKQHDTWRPREVLQVESSLMRSEGIETVLDGWTRSRTVLSTGILVLVYCLDRDGMSDKAIGRRRSILLCMINRT